MNAAPKRPARRTLRQRLLAGLLALALPLQGLAAGVGSVAAPAHFHVGQAAASGDTHELDHWLGLDDDGHEPAHAHAHAHAAGEAHAGIGHHRHEPGSGGVVYVAASDGDAGSTPAAQPLPAWLGATPWEARVPALGDPAGPPARAGATRFCTRAVAPPEHPPR